MATLYPKDLQTLLARHGHGLGASGADGIWGPNTANAVEAWFSIGNDLYKTPTIEPPAGTLLPPSWLPACTMKRVIVHWTAGTYTVSDVDKEHYHFIVSGDGKVVRGDNSIKANVSTSDTDGYAAHTKGCNTQSIGISAACMANAKESPFSPGAYPLTKLQWLTLAKIAAECCLTYSIAVTSKTVLQHGEVEKNLGIDQDGKWDINKLPWAPSMSPMQVANEFRQEVIRLTA